MKYKNKEQISIYVDGITAAWIDKQIDKLYESDKLILSRADIVRQIILKELEGGK